MKSERLILSIYRDFGFEDVAVKLSTRPEKRVGSDEVWDRAEAALRIAVEKAGQPYVVCPGEGAFYGPKLELRCATPSAAIGSAARCSSTSICRSVSAPSISARTARSTRLS